MPGMDNQQIPPAARSNDGFPSGTDMFDDAQQYPSHPYDQLFSSGPESGFTEAGWAANAGGYMNVSQSRANPWESTVNHQPFPTNASSTRPLSHSPAAFAHRNDAFGGYAPPHSFSYNHAPHNNNTQYDPALFNTTTAGPGFDPSLNAFSSSASNGTGNPPGVNRHENHTPVTTAAPVRHAVALERQPSASAVNVVNKPPTPSPTVSILTADGRALAAAIPAGDEAGLFSIIKFDDLARSTKSERMGNFLNVGLEALEWPMNNNTAIPVYVPRKSRNDLRKLAGADTSLLAKINRSASKSSRKERGLRAAFPTSKSTTLTKQGPGTADGKVDLDSSSEDSSDDDNSSYTSEEDLENSPLPSKRPTDPKGAVEYDVVKALWRSKRKPVDGASIRKALADFWDTVKPIRDRWKNDTAAVTEAESKNDDRDLPLLKSRVKDSRELVEVAFKIALKHGHRSIIELFAENMALLYLCYQFLLDRLKENEMNGPLARALLETLSICTTLDAAKLEKTHLAKVLPRIIKKGDAKTQFYAKRVAASAGGVPKESPSIKPTEGKDAKSAANNPATATSKAPPTTSGIKRSASTAAESITAKKVAVGSNKPPNGISSPTNKVNTLARKSAGATDPTKTSSTPAVINKPRPAAAAPSTFFSSLQSATKKPGAAAVKTGTTVTGSTAAKPAERAAGPMSTAAASTAPKSTFSFAETMANLTKPKEQKPTRSTEKELPPETAEVMAKRLRKEARRKLTVTFKPDEQLEEVRYFTHDPEEDFGHDSNQTRDVADVGGEGRMLKLSHQMIDEDDDDDDDVADVPIKLVEFSEPRAIDFADVDPEELKRNYIKYGGPMQPDSPEIAERDKYEANTLIVFYTDSSDIPPTPKEPVEAQEAADGARMTAFGTPSETVTERARQRKAARTYGSAYTPQPASAAPNGRPAAPGFDFGALGQYLKATQAPQMTATAPPPPQPPAASQPPVNIDLQSILANLTAARPAAPPAAPPPSMAPTIPNFAASGPVAPSNAPSGAHIDLGVILAQLNAGKMAPAASAPMSMTPSNPAAGIFENPERKRMREGDWEDSAGANKRLQQQQQQYLFRTKPCKFWHEGKCVKGDNCTYIHDNES